jgi:monoamine oxidase
MGGVLDALVGRIEGAGGQIVFDQRVARIERSNGSLLVYAESPDHDSSPVVYRCKHVILAVPPTMCSKIHFEPALPAARRVLGERCEMGSFVKMIFIYDRTFWRDAGWSGEVLSLAPSPNYPIGMAFDACLATPRPDAGGELVEVPALVAFLVGQCGGAHGAKRLSATERRELVTEQLARHFGDDARHPTAFVEKDWDEDPYAQGCPVNLPPVGVLSDVAKLASESGVDMAASFGRVHFAATETAKMWTGKWMLHGRSELVTDTFFSVVSRCFCRLRIHEWCS